MNASIGKKYELEVCDACKQRITDEMSKLKPRHLLNPKKVALKSLSWLCPVCLERLKRRVQNDHSKNL